MNLTVIGTGSQGNAYLLENEEEALLIECGVNIKSIKQALNFNLKKLVGCIVTHEHMDHAKAIKDLMSCGVDVYSNKGTFEALGIPAGFDKCHHKAHPMHGIDGFKIGNFKIMSFDVKHDAAEPCGFLIYHPETGNVLFMTDLVYSKYTFKNLHNIIIEANYHAPIAKNKLGNMEFLRNRIINSHMSLDTCIDFLKSNDLSKVNNIVLIHLSDSNSDEVLFRTKVEAATGKTVSVADSGLVMELNETPF